MKDLVYDKDMENMFLTVKTLNLNIKLIIVIY